MRPRGALLTGLAALLLLPLGGDPGLDLPLRAPQARTAALLGDDAGTLALARLDPATLAPVARSARIGPLGAWAASPDGRLLALGTSSSGTSDRTTVRFADAATLRLVRRGVTLDGALQAALWAAPARLQALVDTGSSLSVETVDAVAKRVVARRPLDGVAGATARLPDALVLLLEQPNRIAAASVAVVGADGSVRTVRLDRVDAGSSWPQDATADPIGTTRAPALAVDPAGTAYVVDPDGFVAEVDLRTLAVSYHSLAGRSLLGRLAGWLTPAARAKGLNGPVRSAVWLGDGLLAVAGRDYSATRAQDGTASFASTPAGLAVVDTRDWTQRALDPAATDVRVADGALLASRDGGGIAVYGPDGTLRRLLLPGTSPYVAGVVGGLAAVQEDASAGRERYEIVDVATGRVLRRGDGEAPWPLVGSGSD